MLWLRKLFRGSEFLIRSDDDARLNIHVINDDLGEHNGAVLLHASSCQQ